ncbi:hypothetical protein KQH82_07190 [bacterium]|nr:hypothetical protein [bacterium]
MTPRPSRHRTPSPSGGDTGIRTVIINIITVSAAVAAFLWLESRLVSMYYAAAAALVVLVIGELVSIRLRRQAAAEAKSSSIPTQPRSIPSEESRSRTRLTILSSSLRTSPSIRVAQVKRTAERLGDIESELIHRISERYPTDRRMRTLMAELQICSSRMKAQLNDCCLHDCSTVTSRESVIQN